MTEVTPTRHPRRPHRQGRIFPEFTTPPEELARRKAERDTRYNKAKIFFDQVCPQLIDNHYDWFIIIEPNSGDYFIDTLEQAAEAKACQKYPSGWLVTFRLNQTGTCSRI